MPDLEYGRRKKPQKKYKKENSKKDNDSKTKSNRKEKAEKYWEKVRIQEDGCVAARQMEIGAARIRKR